MFSVTSSLEGSEKKRWIAYKKTICLLILVGASILGNIATVVICVFSNTKSSENDGKMLRFFVLYFIFADCLLHPCRTVSVYTFKHTI